MPRMKILNTVEQQAFDTPPMLNSVQRKRFFYFPSKIRHLAADMRTPTNRLCFLVTFGCFKATKRFFSAQKFHFRDIVYVAQRAAIPLDFVDIDNYTKQSLQRHRQLVLKFYAFRTFDKMPTISSLGKSERWHDHN